MPYDNVRTVSGCYNGQTIEDLDLNEDFDGGYATPAHNNMLYIEMYNLEDGTAVPLIRAFPEEYGINSKSAQTMVEFGTMPKKQEKTYRENRLIDKFYEHLKGDDVEGYYEYPYCDTTGNPTVGAGLRLVDRQSLNAFTMSSRPGTINADNPAWSPEQKNVYWNRQLAQCRDSSFRKLKVPSQYKEYERQYPGNWPYFQSDELKGRVKEYIRREIPFLERKMAQQDIDFWNDYNDNWRIANLDFQYNLGNNKFKLGSGPDCWRYYTAGLQAGDLSIMAEQSRRSNVGQKRNDIIKDLLLRGRD